MALVEVLLLCTDLWPHWPLSSNILSIFRITNPYFHPWCMWLFSSFCTLLPCSLLFLHSHTLGFVVNSAMVTKPSLDSFVSVQVLPLSVWFLHLPHTAIRMLLRDRRPVNCCCSLESSLLLTWYTSSLTGKLLEQLPFTDEETKQPD